MNVEKLKKMNELSKELQKHGMADSTSEAFTKAGEVVRDEAFSQIVKEPESKDGFNHQYQIMLERQNRELVQEINSLKEKIAAMQADIEMLKADNNARPAAQEKPKQETQTKFPQKPESKEHPKQGEYTPEDVAVDKVFYFGKK
jgi:hypothetical protein